MENVSPVNRVCGVTSVMRYVLKHVYRTMRIKSSVIKRMAIVTYLRVSTVSTIRGAQGFAVITVCRSLPRRLVSGHADFKTEFVMTDANRDGTVISAT